MKSSDDFERGTPGFAVLYPKNQTKNVFFLPFKPSSSCESLTLISSYILHINCMKSVEDPLVCLGQFLHVNKNQLAAKYRKL